MPTPPRLGKGSGGSGSDPESKWEHLYKNSAREGSESVGERERRGSKKTKSKTRDRELKYHDSDGGDTIPPLPGKSASSNNYSILNNRNVELSQTGSLAGIPSFNHSASQPTVPIPHLLSSENITIPSYNPRLSVS